MNRKGLLHLLAFAAGPLLSGLLGAGLLAFNTAHWRDTPLDEMPSSWRFWNDTSIAIGAYLDRVAAPEGPMLWTGGLRQTAAVYQTLINRQVRLSSIRHWQFWRTLNTGPFLKHRQPYAYPTLEDPGRARLLALAFRLLGGIAPFMGLWLGVLCAIPVLTWLCAELHASGLSVAPKVVAVVVGCSPYVVDSLSLPHSAVGFYLIATLGLASLAVYVVRCERPGWGALSLRLVACGFLIAVCALCRSSVVFLVPGFSLAALLGWHKVRRGQSRLRSLALAFGGLLLLLGPYAAVRPQQHHDVWLALWEGLGDYGADRGYRWSDVEARQFLRSRGVPVPINPEELSPVAEEHLRRHLLQDVSEHPRWYLGILVRRLLATVSLSKLAPYGPRDGASLSAPYFHYKYTTPVDWIGVGAHYRELPISVVLGPTLLLVPLWILARRRSKLAQSEARVRSLGIWAIVVGLGTLGLPLAISTAGAIETQAFALIYALGAGLAAEELVHALRARIGGGSSHSRH